VLLTFLVEYRTFDHLSDRPTRYSLTTTMHSQHMSWQKPNYWDYVSLKMYM